MEEKKLMEFCHSVGICDELNSKVKKWGIWAISNILIGIILSYWLYSHDWLDYSEGKVLLALFIITGIISCVSSIKFAAMYDNLRINLSKNRLELKSTYISGSYTEYPKLPNNEKYFKIPYEQIDKIETPVADIKAETFHNLIIYHDGGWIKLTLSSPSIAKTKIYEMMQKNKSEEMSV